MAPWTKVSLPPQQTKPDSRNSTRVSQPAKSSIWPPLHWDKLHISRRARIMTATTSDSQLIGRLGLLMASQLRLSDSIRTFIIRSSCYIGPGIDWNLLNHRSQLLQLFPYAISMPGNHLNLPCDSLKPRNAFLCEVYTDIYWFSETNIDTIRDTWN